MIILIVSDALDAANNKKAIQESEKVLRKDPQCQTAKVIYYLMPELSFLFVSDFYSLS